MKVLIIANARYKGGLSGSDGIYLAFKKYWPAEITIWEMMDIDFKPFFLCYSFRIIWGCLKSLSHFGKYDMVYSASDFLMDSLPALIMKLKGNKWIAGFYMFAPRDNFIYFYSQKMAYWIIKKCSDMVIVTNPTYFSRFKENKKTWINGGIDLELCGITNKTKKYDAVFIGRIHRTKGIYELMEIWARVRAKKPNALLAVIGDGDLGKEIIYGSGIDLYGYMGKERFEIYKKSKLVLYPTPPKYDHFSIAPVEAMACGCPMVCFITPTIEVMAPPCIACTSINSFSKNILRMLDNEILIKKSDFGKGFGGETTYYTFTHLSESSYEWAKQFSWPLQTQRVWEDITKCVF